MTMTFIVIAKKISSGSWNRKKKIAKEKKNKMSVSPPFFECTFGDLQLLSLPTEQTTFSDGEVMPTADMTIEKDNWVCKD